MSWIQTYTGGKFDFNDLENSDIRIEDIAHALSMICRYSGHCLKFHSVAEHSVFVSKHVPPEFALEGLLHDATEAYINDMVSPLKPLFPEFKKLESKIWDQICRTFWLTPGIKSPEVKWADNLALGTEVAQNMIKGPEWSWVPPKCDEELKFLSPPAAEMLFLDRYEELTGFKVERFVV